MQEVDTEFEKDIFDVALDNEKAKAEEKKLLPPEGWYTSEVGSMLVTPKLLDDGRRTARFFGTFINNKDTEVTTKLGFGVSPDYRASQKDEDKADWSYRMFLGARRAFVEATGVEPERESDVIRYLAEYPVQVRVTHTKDNEAMIVAFRAVREN